MTRVAQLLKYIFTLAVAGLFGAGLSAIAPAQSPTEESLNYIANLFANQTLEKFDTVFFQDKIVTGEIKNNELSFRVEKDQRATYPMRELAALFLEEGKGEAVLRSGKRVIGQLLTPLEIALAGLENQKIVLVPEALETVIIKGQHRFLLSSADLGAKFQGSLMIHLQRSISKYDLLVLKNEGIMAGAVANPVFQINDFYFNRETIAEIIFGSSGSQDQLRARSGQLVLGAIRNLVVTIRFVGEEVRFSFAIQGLARVFFREEIKPDPLESGGSGPEAPKVTEG